MIFNKTLENSYLYLTQLAISGGLVVLLFILMSKYIQPSEIGLYVLAQIYSGIAVGIANLGLLVGYERNFFLVHKKDKKLDSLISSVFYFASLNLVLVFIIFSIYREDMSNFLLGKNIDEDFLSFVLIGTIFSSLAQYLLVTLKNQSKVLKYVIISIINSFLYFGVTVFLLLVIDIGIMSVVYGWLISNSMLLLILYIEFRQRFTIDIDRNLFKDVFLVSLPLTPKVFFGVFNTQLDKIILGLIGSPMLVGVYHLGQTFAMSIFQFMTALGKVFQPGIYRMLFEYEMHKSTPDIQGYIYPFFYFSILMALIIGTFSREITFLFLSDDYMGAGPIITILAIYYSAIFFGKVNGPQLIFCKKTGLVTILFLLGIIINFIMNLLLIPLYGINGAAAATAVSGIAITSITFIFAQKNLKLFWSFRKIFLPYYFFIIGCSLSMLDFYFIGENFPIIIFKIIVIVVYFYLGKNQGLFKAAFNRS